jgi:phosphoserine phosphatase
MDIALLDFDNTLFEGFSRYELGYLMEEHDLIEKGFTKKVKKLQTEYEDGQISYNQKFADDKEIFSHYYSGIKRTDIIEFMRNEFDWDKFLYPNSKRLIRVLKEHRYLTVIISGCWDFILEEAQQMLDFDTFFSSSFMISGGKLTEDFNTVLDYKNKRFFSKKIIEDADNTIGLGDSVADFEFLNIVDHSFLFEPRSDAVDSAKGKGFKLVNRANVVDEVREVL